MPRIGHEKRDDERAAIAGKFFTALPVDCLACVFCCCGYVCSVFLFCFGVDFGCSWAVFALACFGVAGADFWAAGVLVADEDALAVVLSATRTCACPRFGTRTLYPA